MLQADQTVQIIPPMIPGGNKISIPLVRTESPTSIDSAAKDSLNALANQIKNEIGEVLVHARMSLSHARRAGELLIQAKQQVRHGEWRLWVENHCEISERTARLYMQIAEKWDELEANRQSIADLTVSGAIKLLAKPKTLPEPTTDAGTLEEGVPKESPVPSQETQTIATTSAGSTSTEASGEQFGSVMTTDEAPPRAGEPRVPALEVRQLHDPAPAIAAFKMLLEELLKVHETYSGEAREELIQSLETVKLLIDEATITLRSDDSEIVT